MVLFAVSVSELAYASYFFHQYDRRAVSSGILDRSTGTGLLTGTGRLTGTRPSGSFSASQNSSSTHRAPAPSRSSSSQSGSQAIESPSSVSGSQSNGAPLAATSAGVEVTSISGQLYSEVFIPTTYSEYASLNSTLTTFTTNSQSQSIPIVNGPGGLGWANPRIPSTVPQLPPPTQPPSLRTERPKSTHTLVGAEITATSIKGVTKNTKTTTSEGGHKTVFPIVFCLLCGGSGGGGKSWIIHPPTGIDLNGVELHIPHVDFPFKIGPAGDPEPINPSGPEAEPEEDNNRSKSDRSKSQESKSTEKPSSASSTSSQSSSSSSTSSSSSSSSGTRSVRIATSIDVDPYATEILDDQIADVQSYLNSLFAGEIEGTTMTTMTQASASPTSNPKPVTFSFSSFTGSHTIMKPSSSTKTSKTPPPTPPPSPATSSAAPDVDSPLCQVCGSDLGASDCKPEDNQCPLDQCHSDPNCQKCGVDCTTYIGIALGGVTRV